MVLLSGLKLMVCGPADSLAVGNTLDIGGHDLAGDIGGCCALNGVLFLWLNGVLGSMTGTGRGLPWKVTSILVCT